MRYAGKGCDSAAQGKREKERRMAWKVQTSVIIIVRSCCCCCCCFTLRVHSAAAAAVAPFHPGFRHPRQCSLAPLCSLWSNQAFMNREACHQHAHAPHHQSSSSRPRMQLKYVILPLLRDAWVSYTILFSSGKLKHPSFHPLYFLLQRLPQTIERIVHDVLVVRFIIHREPKSLHRLMHPCVLPQLARCCL